MKVNVLTRFNPGDKVYLLYKGRPTEAAILLVSVKQTASKYRPQPEIDVRYVLGHPVLADSMMEGSFLENELFATTKELKDSLFAEIEEQ